MMRKIPHGLGVALLSAALVVGAPVSASAALSCDKIPQLASHFLKKHVSQHIVTEEFKRQTADAFLDRVDPSKTLFLKAEAEAIRHSFGGIFQGIRSGDCQPLEVLNTKVVARYQDLESKVRSVVSADDFEVNPDTQVVIDPDDRGRPVDAAAQGALLRRQIDFQIANYLGAGTTLPKARERLIHRYELFTKRAKELDAEDLRALFLDSFAVSLDPHSNYLSADSFEDFQIQMRLSLEGIGVALSSREGYSIVERVLPGGATSRTNALRHGDRILGVAQDGGEIVDIIDMGLRDVVRLIRGKRGTPVHLSVLREGETTERFRVTIIRDKIDLEEQWAKVRFETVPGKDRDYKLGIVELTSFYGDKDAGKRQSANDVARLLEEVESEKADGLVLDLSRNGGGLLEHAVEISGFFIRKGGVVAVRERSGPPHVHEDPHDDVRYAGPLVVLVSRASASASEILAGALKDYRRAVIVGDDHSFGKGTVQTVVPLGRELGALKVTTAMFYRPSGVSTQRAGVESDVRIPSLFNTDRFGEASHANALPPQRIRGFRSDSTVENWLTIEPEVVEELAMRSKQRVAESEAFQAILEELAKSEARGGIVKVADILGDKLDPVSEPAPGGSSGAAVGQALASAPSDTTAPKPEAAAEAVDAEDDETKLTPQVEEALHILADLVTLQEASDG